MSEKIYMDTDIVSISGSEILFADGHLINLVECASRWAEAKGITARNYRCVGDRNIDAFTPYFDIYSRPVTRIIFKKRGLPGSRRNIKEFERLRAQIGESGWTLRDIS